jgi:kinesin family protein 7
LDASEERRMLELDEAIEAVDAAIEYKNEVICSRHYELKSSVSVGKHFQFMIFSKKKNADKYLFSLVDGGRVVV